jgi:hypothetical protein
MLRQGIREPGKAREHQAQGCQQEQRRSLAIPIPAFLGDASHEGLQFLARFLPLAGQQQRREGPPAAFAVPAQVPHKRLKGGPAPTRPWPLSACPPGGRHVALHAGDQAVLRAEMVEQAALADPGCLRHPVKGEAGDCMPRRSALIARTAPSVRPTSISAASASTTSSTP